MFMQWMRLCIAVVSPRAVGTPSDAVVHGRTAERRRWRLGAEQARTHALGEASFIINDQGHVESSRNLTTQTQTTTMIMMSSVAGPPTPNSLRFQESASQRSVGTLLWEGVGISQVAF